MASIVFPTSNAWRWSLLVTWGIRRWKSRKSPARRSEPSRHACSTRAGNCASTYRHSAVSANCPSRIALGLNLTIVCVPNANRSTVDATVPEPKVASVIYGSAKSAREYLLYPSVRNGPSLKTARRSIGDSSDVRMNEVISLEQQRLARNLRKRIAEAVAEIESRRMPALAVATPGLTSHIGLVCSDRFN
jgi:hypothetical protein